MTLIPSPSYSITIRVAIENQIGMFALIATAISNGEEISDLLILYVLKRAR